jgi:hypothetical protein
MIFEFGETAESKDFFDRNPTFFGNFEELTKLSNKCFGREMIPDNLLEDVVFSVGHTCRDDFVELLFLAVNGYGSAASKIFRGLYERTVTLAYLAENPGKVERFVRFAAVQEHRALEAALKTVTEQEFDQVVQPPNLAAQIRERYKQVKPEFQATLCKKCGTTRTQSSWDVDFGTMVQRVGDPYRYFYLGAYAVPTLQIHATWASAFNGRDLEQKASIEDRHREADLVVHGATRIFTLVVGLQNRVFALGLDAEIEAYEKVFMEAWIAQQGSI